MDFKSQLKSAESNKDKKILDDFVNDIYNRIKSRCMQSAEWGYSSTNIYIKELLREQRSREQFLDSDYKAIFRQREDSYELDNEDVTWWVFKDPEKITEMQK